MSRAPPRANAFSRPGLASTSSSLLPTTATSQTTAFGSHSNCTMPQSSHAPTQAVRRNLFPRRPQNPHTSSSSGTSTTSNAVTVHSSSARAVAPENEDIIIRDSTGGFVLDCPAVPGIAGDIAGTESDEEDAARRAMIDEWRQAGGTGNPGSGLTRLFQSTPLEFGGLQGAGVDENGESAGFRIIHEQEGTIQVVRQCMGKVSTTENRKRKRNSAGFVGGTDDDEYVLLHNEVDTANGHATPRMMNAQPANETYIDAEIRAVLMACNERHLTSLDEDGWMFGDKDETEEEMS